MVDRWQKFTRDTPVTSATWYSHDWGLFAYSFKKSADLVYDEYKRTRREAFWFPCIYLYRQWMELALKSLLHKIRILDDSVASTPYIHTLCPLWSPARSWLIAAGAISDEDEFLKSAERVFVLFDELDPRGTAYRYPPLELPHPDILNFSLDDFERAIDEVDTIFFGLFNTLQEYEPC